MNFDNNQKTVVTDKIYNTQSETHENIINVYDTTQSFIDFINPFWSFKGKIKSLNFMIRLIIPHKSQTQTTNKYMAWKHF
jgi:hypothetical protein